MAWRAERERQGASMQSIDSQLRRPGPPTFEQARNKRQKVRSAGLDPDYWYAVEYTRNLKCGEVTQVRFWGREVAVYRAESGKLYAMEDRCAHRQLPLSKGLVEGERLVCTYHGWKYGGGGELEEVSHELFGRKLPRCRLTSYPLRERYGLIWLFFGDAERAEQVPMPEIPELEGEDRWACVPIDFTWNAHHSMIIDNVSDFTHAYLHRKYRPFTDSTLKGLEERDDKVFLSYDAKVGRGRFSGLFVDRDRVDTNAIDLCYDYPYQWSNTDDQIKHWCFVLPIDERTTRVFFLFYFAALKVPVLPVTIPRALMTPLLQIANKVLIGPLLSEDGFAVEAEQAGWERHYEAPIAELSPAVHAFQALTVRKWEEYLEREKAKRTRSTS
jgi:phenylpropionate dioxygenase-like ring-hydroxylating dioxygenase large terminal subunit